MYYKNDTIMLRCFFIVLFFVTNSFYLEAQNTKDTVLNILNTPKKFRVKDLTKKDTTNSNLIRLECSGRFHSSKYHPAWIINGNCFSEYDIEELEPKLIRSSQVEKRDTIIHDIKFDCQIIIEYKEKLPKQELISLSELKAKYTTLGDAPTIYAIDNKLVKGADKVLLDENSIYNVEIDDMINPKENLKLKIISILLK